MAKNNVVVRASVTGLPNLQRKMKALGEVGRAAVVIPALADAVTPIQAQAQANAPQRRIAQAIRVLGAEEVSRGHFQGVVGVRPKDRSFHALFVEMGTGERKHKSGKSVGAMPAQPFLRPALDDKADDAVRRFGDNIVNAMEKVCDG